MAIDYTKLSDEELSALQSGDLSKISEQTLAAMERSFLEEERATRTVQVPSSAFSYARPEISGATFKPEEETIRSGQTAALRYIPPIAVGMATGGVGLAPAAITALTAGASELLAQLSEGRKQISPEEIAASTISGGAPIFAFKPAAVPAAELISPAVKSFLATASSQITANEAARYIQKGEFAGLEGKTIGERAKEGVLRWGLPVGVSALAAKGSQLEAAAQKIEALKAQRGGGSVMLSEIQPKYTQLESNQIQMGNRNAIALADGMDMNMAEVVTAAYGSLPPASQAAIAQDLAPYVGRLEEARIAATKADEAARIANENLKVAERTRSADLGKLKIAAEVAQNESLLTRNNFDAMVADVFGPRTPVLTSQASVGALQQRMKAVASQAEKGVESGLDALYANAGVRPNDVVVSKEDVIRSINSRKAAGRAFEGNVAREEALNAANLFFGENEVATLEQLRKFKTVIADKLPKDAPADAAGRLAGALYDSLKMSSERFVRSNFPEETFVAFRDAQNRAAANFRTRDVSAIDLLAKGDFNAFYSAIKDEGRVGNIMKEIDAYASSLTRLTNQAVESGQLGTATAMRDVRLAMDFKKDVNSIILNGIIKESIPDLTGGLAKVQDVVDPKKLMQTLGEFEKWGFTLRQLGIGNKEVSDLIKANAMVGKEPLTVGKLNDFLSLLPTTRSDVAAARIAYRTAVADAMIQGGAKERTDAFNKAKRIADKANLDANARQVEFVAAQNDPLTRFFAENGSMLIGNGALQNSNWVDLIIKKDPDTIQGFVNALNASGRSATVDKMREAAVAFAVKRFMPAIQEGAEKVNALEITNLFSSSNPSVAVQRANLKAIIGSNEYDRLVTTIVNPIREILLTRHSLNAPIAGITDEIKGVLSAQALATGRPTAGVIYANAVRNALNLITKERYNILSGVWLNPSYGKELSRAGYDLDRFVDLSERNRMAVQLANQKDDQEKQDRLRQQYIR